MVELMSVARRVNIEEIYPAVLRPDFSDFNFWGVIREADYRVLYL
jgi:hypothetical protein